MDLEQQQAMLEQVKELHAQDQFLQIIELLEPMQKDLAYVLGIELARAYINAANANQGMGEDYYALANALLDKYVLDGKKEATYLFYKGYALFKLGLVNDAALRFEMALPLIKLGQEDELFGKIKRLLSLCKSLDPDNQDYSLSKQDEQLIDEHIKQFFGKYQILFKTDRYELLHIPPTEEHPFNLIVTKGLAGRKLNVPMGVDPLANSRLELCLCLPFEWEFTNAEEYNLWPINTLCELINFILSTDEFVGFGYTFSQGKVLHSSTSFVGGMLTALGHYPARCQEVYLSDNAVVHFFELVFLYPMEVAYRQSHSAAELLERFYMQHVEPSPVRNRKDVCMVVDSKAEKI